MILISSVPVLYMISILPRQDYINDPDSLPSVQNNTDLKIIEIFPLFKSNITNFKVNVYYKIAFCMLVTGTFVLYTK